MIDNLILIEMLARFGATVMLAFILWAMITLVMRSMRSRRMGFIPVGKTQANQITPNYVCPTGTGFFMLVKGVQKQEPHIQLTGDLLEEDGTPTFKTGNMLHYSDTQVLVYQRKTR